MTSGAVINATIPDSAVSVIDNAVSPPAIMLIALEVGPPGQAERTIRPMANNDGSSIK